MDKPTEDCTTTNAVERAFRKIKRNTEGQFNGQCPLRIAYIVPVLDRFYAEKVHLGLNMRYRFTHEDELIEAALNEASSELNRFGLNLLNECR